MRALLALASLMLLLPAVPAGGEAVHEVVIRDRAFSPTLVTMATLDTVVWTNEDGITHTVTAIGGAFSSGPLAPGDTFTWTADSPTAVVYRCTLHLTMLGVLVVT